MDKQAQEQEKEVKMLQAIRSSLTGFKMLTMKLNADIETMTENYERLEGANQKWEKLLQNAPSN
eukprot:m.83481 g.83481  ORF g.83481 m.83481 type:complete len:64 (+) comp25637_c0_seq1:40-231(+)